jgi:membrane associated rhomboid family serine protease
MFQIRELNIFKRGIYITLSFVLLLWGIKSIEWARDLDLGYFGILPRTLRGSIGIITGPLIHGDLLHLMSNTFPLLVLGLGLFYFYHKIALEVFAWIYLATGFWVWVIGREAYHIGASGIVYGLMMFIFWGGVFRKNPRSLALSMIIFFLYGYMIYGIFPGDDGVSWESHLMGSVAGIFLAIYFKKVPIYVGEPAHPLQATEPEDKIYKPGNEGKWDHTYPENVQLHYEFREKDQHGKSGDTGISN